MKMNHLSRCHPPVVEPEYHTQAPEAGAGISSDGKYLGIDVAVCLILSASPQLFL